VPESGMRVVVTSRPGPGLPDDVPDDHPLRARDVVRALAPWSHAAGTRRLARLELRRLLADVEVGVPLLGLLVAARGALAAGDLARLVGVRPFKVDLLLRGITGRSFVPDSHGQAVVPDPSRAPQVHALGHEDLRQGALHALGDTAEYEHRLHAWADGYRERGWPPDTPSYLLYDYPRMLHTAGDVKRLSDFALDPRRQRALMERAALDSAFAQIELTAELVRRRCPGDLVELTALAASSAVLAERAWAIPADVPVAFALLGQPRRAIDVALVAPLPADKALRLAGVAVVLDKAADGLAGEAAGLAGRWADRARRESSPSNGDEQEAQNATGEAAVALIAVGELRRGRELLDRLGALAEGGQVAGATVVARAARAARSHDPALAEDLLDRAERYAEELAAASLPDPRAAIEAWAAVAGAAEGPRAERMHERIGRYARAFAQRLTGCAVQASAASALGRVRAEEAKEFADRAAGRLEAALRSPDDLLPDDEQDLTLYLFSMLTLVVQGLIDTGSADRARRLVEAVPEKRRTGLFGADTLAGARRALSGGDEPEEPSPSPEALARTARRLAESGEQDKARRRLSQALEALGSSQGTGQLRMVPFEGWLVSLCAALSAIGRPKDGAQLAQTLRNPADQVQALAAAAVSAAKAGRPDDARRLAEKAADQARAPQVTTGAFFEHEVADATSAAAQALAHAGDRERAMVLAGATGPPAHILQQRTLVAVAAGLRCHDPAGAVGLIDRQRERILAVCASHGWDGRLAELAELFAAIGDADTACVNRLHQAAQHAAEQLMQSSTPWREREDLLTVALLHARHEHREALDRLTSLERQWTGGSSWGPPPVALPVVRAALGDTAGAQQLASSYNTYERAEASAAVAGYLAGVPSGIRTVSDSPGTAFTEIFRSFAVAVRPPGVTQSLRAAREFTADALAGDGWHCALGVLAHLEPGAVERVRDIVFVHRGLAPRAPQDR
ncbi:hypothetical protein, partial [Streptomyces sp. NPDC058461]